MSKGASSADYPVTASRPAGMSTRDTRVWGVPLTVAARRSDPQRALIPDLVLTSLRWLDKANSPAGAWCEAATNEDKVAALKARFDQGLRVTISPDESPATVTTLVLRFLAAVPNGVIQSVCEGSVRFVAHRMFRCRRHCGRSRRLGKVQLVLRHPTPFCCPHSVILCAGQVVLYHSLPPSHIATLTLLFNHLHVAQNRAAMEAKDLAAAVAHALAPSPLPLQVSGCRA